MQIGTAEHKAQYFENKIKEIRESIFFGEFQIWTIKQSVEKMMADKKEAEGKLERKEFKTANEGKKEIDRINEAIQGMLMQRANIENQNVILENRIIEVGEYIKEIA